MKNRAQPGKALDITEPKRRATSAYMKTLMQQYHTEYITPLHQRLALAEGIIAAWQERFEALEARCAELEERP